MAVIGGLAAAIAVVVLLSALLTEAGDTNRAFSPCSDARVQRSDGFTFGIAFASKDKFFYSNNSTLQLSPCDARLSLSNANSQVSVFRPKVDEISILTVNSSSFVAVCTLFPCVFLLSLHRGCLFDYWRFTSLFWWWLIQIIEFN